MNTCDICNKNFQRNSHLVVHRRIHTGEKPYSCEQCGKKFAQKSDLTTHKNIHTGERPYSCDKCEKTFNQRSSLIKHKWMHTREPYSCDQCEKSFARISALNMHKMSHFSCSLCDKHYVSSSELLMHKESPEHLEMIKTSKNTVPLSASTVFIECEVDVKEEIVSSSESLIHNKSPEHLEKKETCNNTIPPSVSTSLHTHKKPYSCDQCEKSFARISALNMHKMSHYYCKLCDKHYASSLELLMHKESPGHLEMLETSNTVPPSASTVFIECEVDIKEEIVSNSELLMHRIFPGQLKMMETCNNTVPTSVYTSSVSSTSNAASDDDLQDEGKNSATAKIVCAKIKKIDEYEFNLEQSIIHQQPGHSGQIQPGFYPPRQHNRYDSGGMSDVIIGDFGVPIGRIMTRSMSRSSQSSEIGTENNSMNTCDICNKNFTKKSHLVDHRRVHTGEKPYSCDQCEKSFSKNSTLTMHKRIHTGERPYSCDFCEQTFNQWSSWNKHKKMHTHKKPYPCDQCEMSFARISALNMHKMSHFSCSLCDKHYVSSSELLMHKESPEHLEMMETCNNTVPPSVSTVFIECDVDVKEEIVDED